jgi:ketosteroid isomerase-like protein
MLTGRAAVRKWASDMYDQVSVAGTYPSSEVQLMGDWAVQRYSVSMTMTPKNGGAAVPFHGKGLHVFRRQPDGTWLIAQDIWNEDAPPAAVTPAITAPVKK